MQSLEDLSRESGPIGVLTSGGLDSAILAAHLAKSRPVCPIYIGTDVVWRAAEQQGLHRFLAACNLDNLSPVKVLELPVADIYGTHWSVSGIATPAHDDPDETVFLPGRTALLAVKACVWCQLQGLNQLALAPLGTSPFADARAEFLGQFEQAMNQGAPAKVRLLRPFGQMHKRQVMELGRELPLELTFSCIRPVEMNHCGQCNKCFERQEAFRRSEIIDKTRYAA